MALTDEQIIACWERACYGLGKYEKFARAIESAACAERDARIAELERQLAEAYNKGWDDCQATHDGP